MAVESRWISELNRTLTGRMLSIWDGTSDLPAAVEEAYRDLFRKESGKVEAKSKCGWRGKDTGDKVKCGPCSDKGMEVRLKLFVCKHPEIGLRANQTCTVTPADPGVPDCLNCKKFDVNAVPGPEPESLNPEDARKLASSLKTSFPDLQSLDHGVVRDAHILLLREAISNPPPVNAGNGRGFVMGVGGTLYFQCALVATSVLRSLGCQLPGEWWHLGKSELDPRMVEIASTFGITCRNALDVVESLPEKDRPRILNGWELKPFSVAHSAFREVLYLDADNICVQDPTFLFDSSAYQEHGAIFWPDLPPYDRKEWVPETAWNNVGLEKREETDFESGQFLIDKGRRSRELGVTVHINDHSDWYYKFVYGDKTTYHLAWRVCGSDYAMPKTAAGWSWPSILQHDFDGKLLFQHVCQGKPQLAEGKPLNLVMKSEAVQAARLLHGDWHGGIWSWLDQNDRERELMSAYSGRWKYTRTRIEGNPSRILELLPKGVIGGGYAGCEQQWSVRILNGIPTIIITGEAHKGTRIGMMFLTESEDGIWRGRWQAHERNPVELEKVP